ncbi:DUF742 domain-containing protein [Peterkaempfera bronchialis]|uniref:DUF742 domain-containing protein n=1 Tax=Peterkaempfera bronchialis TaxID=2126346 RepID=A0A345T0R5_9ACTN|nr:DUF742 domain-containing protein [Peterkaempfera bronchialis]AXI79570.1 DUF742 domain-containing protein [Peterkaempfera bronchialis]
MTPPDDRSGPYGVPYPGTGHDAFGAPGTGYGSGGHGAHGRPGGGQQFPQRGDGRRWTGPDGYDQDYGRQQYESPYPQHQDTDPYGGGYGQTAPADPYPEQQVPDSYAEDFPDDFPEDTGDGHDDEPLIRPFAMTGGRTRPRYELAIEALVSSTASPERIGTLLPEHQRICTLCTEIKSVAEVSALLSMPLGVARILVADLAEAGLVAIHQPAAGGESGGQPDVTLLERVLSGLRKL